MFQISLIIKIKTPHLKMKKTLQLLKRNKNVMLINSRAELNMTENGKIK